MDYLNLYDFLINFYNLFYLKIKNKNNFLDYLIKKNFFSILFNYSIPI